MRNFAIFHEHRVANGANRFDKTVLITCLKKITPRRIWSFRPIKPAHSRRPLERALKTWPRHPRCVVSFSGSAVSLEITLTTVLSPTKKQKCKWKKKGLKRNTETVCTLRNRVYGVDENSRAFLNYVTPRDRKRRVYEHVQDFENETGLRRRPSIKIIK